MAHRLLALGAVLYAALLLAVSLIWSPVGDLDVEADFFAELGPAARAIAAGELDVANHPYKGPLQPLLTAGLYALLEPFGVGWYRSAVVVSILGTLLALGATRRLAHDLCGGRAALAAVVLTAANPLVFVQGHKAASDALFLGLATAAAAAALAPRPGAHRWLAVGLLAGAAMLTRYAGAVLVVWAVAVAALVDPGEPARRRLRSAAQAVSGALVVVGPWLLLNLAQAGTLLATRNAENVAREYAGLTTVAAVGRYLENLPLRAIQFAHAGTGWPLALVAVLGIVVLWSRRGPRGPALLAWGAGYLAVLALVFHLPRFTLPLVPVAAVAAACLLCGAPSGDAPAPLHRLRRGLARRGHALGWVLVVLLAAAAAPRAVTAVRFHAAQQPQHLAGAVAYLRAVADATPDAVVMARKAHAPFAARLAWRPYPGDALTAAAFVRDAAARDVDYVLAGRIEERHTDVGFELGYVAELVGVAVAYEDGATTVYHLDADHPELGHDPERARLRADLAARRSDAAVGVVETARRLAARLRRGGEVAAAQSLLAETVAAAPATDPAVLVARVDLAWTCLLSGDHDAGLRAIGPVLAAFADQPDRALEARAHEYLGIHLASVGRTNEARRFLERAAATFGAAGRPDDRQRVLGVLRGLPASR